MTKPLSEPIKIDLVGAGGNGSWLIPMLARVAEQKRLKITIWDHDIVEKKNTRNQNLPFIKIGQPKAQVLTEFYNTICKPLIPIEFKAKKYDLPSTDIVISAVDNNETRLAIADHKRWQYWVDCGVEKDRAYAALNTQKVKVSTEIFIKKEGTSSGLACTMFLTPSQNIIAAGSAFLMLYNILYDLPIEKRFLVYNKEHGISNISLKQNPDQFVTFITPASEDSLNVMLLVDKAFSTSWLYKWIYSDIFTYQNPISLIKHKTMFVNPDSFSYPGIMSLAKINASHGEGSKTTVQNPVVFSFDTDYLKKSPATNFNYSIISNGNGACFSLHKYRPPAKMINLGGMTNKPFHVESSYIDKGEVKNLGDVIKASLASFVLYQQMRNRTVNKVEVNWQPNLLCSTAKLSAEHMS